MYYQNKKINFKNLEENTYKEIMKLVRKENCIMNEYVRVESFNAILDDLNSTMGNSRFRMLIP